MNAAGAKPRRRPLWVYLLAGLLSSLLLLAALGWYLTSNSFQSMVRHRLVAELERATGGRVELGAIHTSPLRFRVSISNLTIHGREARGEVPFAHVDRAVAVVRIVSVLGFEFSFHSLTLDHPVVHLVEYPDGTTNQPAPEHAGSTQNQLQRLFALSVSRLEVRHGEWILNDRVTPLDFTASDVSADMSYSFLHRRYQTDLLVGKIVTHYKDYRPFAWMAEAHFSLGERSLQITSLRASSGRSRLEVSGEVPDFRRPHLTAKYRVTLDLAEAAGILRFPPMRKGIVTADGQGRWSQSDFSSRGNLTAQDVDWHDRSLDLANASGSAEFSVDNQHITLAQLQARLLGGTLSGSADVSGWAAMSQPAATKRSRNASEAKGAIDLRVKGISAGALANALSTSSHPLRLMNLAGAASGTVAVRWKGKPQNATAEFALDVAPPSSPTSSQLPVTAQVRAIYDADSGNLEVANLSASTRASRISASGQLASAGALRISFTTSNLNEWQPILAALGRPQRIPVLLHGQATFNGTASGRLPNVAFNGNLQATDFEYLAPPTARTPAQTIHWDSLSASMQLSQNLLVIHDGLLRHGSGEISFNLTTQLLRGEYSSTRPFTANANVHDADVAELLTLAGYSYPVRGTVNLSFEASGTGAAPQGTGHLILTDGSIAGEAVQRAECDLRFANGEIQCGQLEIAYGPARVSGNAAYNISSHGFHFDLAGAQFDLAHLPRLRDSRLHVEGKMDFTAHGSGTLEAPEINAAAHVRQLNFDHQPLGDYTLQASSQGANLRLAGRSDFQNSVLNLDATVRMRDDWPVTAQLHFEQVSGDPLLRAYVHSPVAAHSLASGDLRLQGPLRRPEALTVAGELSALQVGVEKVQLHNEGPVRFEIAQDSFRLESFHLTGRGTDLSAHGTMQLNGERPLDLVAQGKLNLRLIETFDSNFTSSGTVAVDMTVGGTVSKPVAQGRLQVDKGAIAYIDLPSALSDINGSIAFNQNHLQIEKLGARTGGGTVKFTGNATWMNRQLNFDLDLQGQEVRLRYPPGVSSTANAHLRFAGSSSGSTLSGDVTVTKLAVMPGFDFGAYLYQSGRSVTLPQTNPLLNRIRLDVHIVTTPELQMQTAAVRLSGDADLRLRGTAARPVVLGRADVLEGQVYFNGTKYELERGNVSFTNPVTTTPLLDLQATTQVRDYDITLNLNGSPDKLKVTYRSEPPLPEADIITLLALGQTTEESAQLQQSSQNAFTQEASSAIISEALNATVSSRVQRLFGVSRIKINPEGISTETNPARGPQVTIEQQVGNHVTLTYSTSVSQTTQQIIQMEYDITRNISIIGLRDQNGVVSFDLRIRRRKK